MIDEGELANHRRGEDEGIEIWLAHRPVDLVQGVGELQPVSNDLTEVRASTRPRRMGSDPSGQVPGFRVGLRPQPEALGRLEGVDDVEIVSKRLGPVLVGMHGGIAAYMVLLPRLVIFGG